MLTQNLRGVAMEGNIFAPVVQRGQTVPTLSEFSNFDSSTII